MYFLDTNVIIDAIRGKFISVTQHFENVERKLISIPSVVIAELEYGARHSGDYTRRKKEFSDFIAPYPIVSFGEKEAVVYGIIREELSSKGQIIGNNDMLIAATVVANGGILVTHNTDEFSRISGLQTEDWRVYEEQTR